MKKKKSIAILGSTGSIGKSTLNVVSRLKNFRVVLIYSDKNFKALINQIKKFKPLVVIINNSYAYKIIKKKFKNKKIVILNDFRESKKHIKKIDVSVSAIPGIIGLEPTIYFTKLSKKVLIANKESIVCGWKLIKLTAKKFKTEICPIDSEHFSINFLLNNYLKKKIKKIYITASGGPFLNLKLKDFSKIKPIDAIKHPKWKMGKKISVDSSTLMNKLLEIIEASNLFELKLNKFDILIHPQSLVHAIVELDSGLKIFLYHETDMKIPIANSLDPNVKYLNIKKITKSFSRNLSFSPVNKKRFPISELIKYVNLNNSSPILLNAANEILVYEFLKKNIVFTDIYRLLKLFLSSNEYIKTSKIKCDSIESIKNIDFIGRRLALKIIKNNA